MIPSVSIGGSGTASRTLLAKLTNEAPLQMGEKGGMPLEERLLWLHTPAAYYDDEILLRMSV